MPNWQDAIAIPLFILIIIGSVMLFIRFVTGTGRGYAQSLRNAQAEHKNRSDYLKQNSDYLKQNLEEIRRRNLILERIANALERGFPPPAGP